MRLMVWSLPGSRSGSSMSTLVYSRLAAFSVSQEVSEISFGKISLMIISLGIAYMLYIVCIVNFNCSLTNLGTLAPRSTIFKKILFVI